MDAAAQISRLNDMFGEEDLVPELAGCLEDHPSLGKTLHHPLVVQVPYFPGLNRMSNRMLAYKTESLEKSIEEGNWHRFVFLHERGYRINALQEVLWTHGVNDPEVFWPLMGSVWTDSETIKDFFDDWLELWDQDIPNRHLAMDEEDRAALAALPEVVTIYRGYGHDMAVNGQSWTTNRDKAVWFANRYDTHDGRTPTLAKAQIKRDHIIAYFLGRSESEVVVNPDDLINVTLENPV